MTIEISMTVNREQLISALKTKRDAIVKHYQFQIDANNSKADVTGDFVGDLAAYHRTLADMLTAGAATFEVTSHGLAIAQHGRDALMRTGRRKTQHGWEQEPNQVAIIAKDPKKTPLPETPDVTRELVEARSTKQKIDALKANMRDAAAPYDAAIQLLEMSVDENVGVPATEYQRLLAGRPDHAGTRGAYNEDEDELD